MTADILPGAEPFSHRGGGSGVLLLHGFTGNPTSMRSIAELCAGAGYSVELPRLPGHGTSVEDMMTTTWADWTKTAEDAYDELSARCERVALVGLSMGGGLVAYLAEEREPLAGCVLINPLVKPPLPELYDGLVAAARRRRRIDRIDRVRREERGRQRKLLRRDTAPSREESFRWDCVSAREARPDHRARACCSRVAKTTSSPPTTAMTLWRESRAPSSASGSRTRITWPRSITIKSSSSP